MCPEYGSRPVTSVSQALKPCKRNLTVRPKLTLLRSVLSQGRTDSERDFRAYLTRVWKHIALIDDDNDWHTSG